LVPFHLSWLLSWLEEFVSPAGTHGSTKTIAKKLVRWTLNTAPRHVAHQRSPAIDKEQVNALTVHCHSCTSWKLHQLMICPGHAMKNANDTLYSFQALPIYWFDLRMD
jgi:hypothetical protein